MTNQEATKLDPSRRALENVHRSFMIVREKYPTINLEHLFEEVRLKSIKCEDLQCSCFSTRRNVINMSELIDYNTRLFRKSATYLELSNEKDPLDAPPVKDSFDEPLDDTKIKKMHRGVKLDMVEKFFKRINKDAFREIENAANMLLYGRDDCIDYLQYEFPHISQGGIKRIVYKIGKGNYVATAFYCFLVENKISERPEFNDLWEKVQPVPKHWVPKMHKRVTKAYCRDRKKKLTGFVTKHARSKYLERRWEEIIKAWRKDYPNLFSKDSNLLDEVAVTNPDPGELFTCAKCRNKRPKLFAITCFQADVVEPNRPQVPQTRDRHQFCRPCSRLIAKVMYNFGMCPENGACMRCPGLTASGRICKNLISTKEVHLHMEPEERYKFNNALISKLVDRFEHVHLEEEPNTQVSREAFTPNDTDEE